MINDWDRIVLLLKLQMEMVNIPALLIGWGLIAVASSFYFRGKKHRKAKWITAFLMYSWFIVGMTLLRANKEEQEAVNLSLNFGSLLFWIKGGRRQMVYSLLNVLLFVPFGFLLMHIRNSHKKLLRVCGCGLMVSMTIEVLQLIGGLGVFELVDIFANALGTWIGAWVGSCFAGAKEGKEYEYECTGKEDDFSET